MKDGILEAELKDAMMAAVSADSETKELIFNNTKNLDTSWRGNGNLHPSGKSTYELYKERHLESDYKGAKKSDLTGLDKDEFETVQADEQNKDLLSRIAAYTAGAFTGVAAAVAKRTGKVADENALKSQVKVLEAKLKSQAKTGRMNMAIAGGVSAVVVGLGTFIATKAYFKNKAKKEEENSFFYERPNDKNGAQDTVNKIKQQQRNVQTQIPTLATVSTPSLAEFKNKLNNS